jgi:hypothetical protein
MNIFSNDGSFLDQFKKISGVKGKPETPSLLVKVAYVSALIFLGLLVLFHDLVCYVIVKTHVIFATQIPYVSFLVLFKSNRILMTLNEKSQDDCDWWVSK